MTHIYHEIFQISSLKILGVAMAMPAFFALVFKIFHTLSFAIFSTLNGITLEDQNSRDKLKKYITILAVILISITSCKNKPTNFRELCNEEEQTFHSKFFEEFFNIKYLSNLEGAIKCSNETNKALFIVFISNPSSGIKESIKRSYRHQVPYLIECKQCRTIIQNDYIPVLLHVGINKKELFNKHDNLYSLNLLQKLITTEQLNSSDQFQNTTKYLGQVHQKFLLATNRSNTFPSYAIIDQSGKILAKYTDNDDSLYSTLKKLKTEPI